MKSSYAARRVLLNVPVCRKNEVKQRIFVLSFKLNDSFSNVISDNFETCVRVMHIYIVFAYLKTM